MKKIILLALTVVFNLNTIFSQNIIYNDEIDRSSFINPVYLYKGDKIIIDFKLLRGKYVKEFIFYKSYLPTVTTGYWSYRDQDVLFNVSKQNFTHKEILIPTEGVYHYSAKAVGNLSIKRIAASKETEDMPTNCYYNKNKGYLAGDLVLDKSVDIPNKNRIVLLDTVMVVPDCTNPNIFSYNFPVELAYRFADGDTLILSFNTKSGNNLSQVDIFNNINTTKYPYKFDLYEGTGTMRSRTKDYAVKINNAGVISFTFAYKGRNMFVNKSSRVINLKIERIPASESVKGLVSKVRYKTIMVEVKHNDNVTKKWPKKVPIID